MDPGDLPNPGIKPRCPALQANSLPAEPPGKSNINNYANKAETLDQIEKCSVGLMCFDEIDEGMDLNAQMMFLRILHNITASYGVDIIVVTHSLMLPILDCSDKVFDMKTRSEVSVCDYMKRLTGKNITIKVEDEKEVH